MEGSGVSGHADKFPLRGLRIAIRQEKNDAEAGKVEEEDKQRGSQDRGTQAEAGLHSTRHGMESAPRERAARFKFWVQAGEGVTHDANDDRRVVENVGEQDRAKGEGWRMELCERGKRKENKPRVPKMALKDDGNYNGRQHERNCRECTQQGFAAKVVTGEEIGGGKPERGESEGWKELPGKR